MATRRLVYEIGFTADTKDLNAKVKDAFDSLQNLGRGSASYLTKDLQEAAKAASELGVHLQNAINKDTGKFDLINFNESLKRSKKSITDYANDLSKLGQNGEEAFLKVAQAITSAELPLKRTHKLFDELWVTMKNTMRWQLTSSALHGFMGTLQSAYGYAQDLNESLNNIRIVTSKSVDEMSAFAKEANKTAQALSTTTTNYTDASLIYYQQGLDEQAVKERTDATIKFANVSRQSAETASEQLTSIWNNFYDGSKSLEYYIDVMVKLGAATASSSEEISQGVQKYAATAQTIGLSYEYAAAALATVTATTRESADVVGTAFKTLFARIQGLQLGETLDDGTTLNKYSKALEQVGISIFDQNNELKEMDDILDELGSKWQTLSKDQQVALAETVAGVRQYTQLIALMDNWDFFQENLSTAYGAGGTLNEQAEIYAESWEAARDRVTAAAENIYDSLINEDFFIGLDDAFTPILNGVATVVDSLGGMGGTATAIGALFLQIYGDKAAEGLRGIAASVNLMTGAEQKRLRALQATTVELAQQTNLVTGKSDDSILRQRNEVLRTEVELRGIVNSSIDKMNSLEKTALQDNLQEIENLKQINALHLSNLETMKQQVETEKEVSFLSLDNSIVQDEEGFYRDFLSQDTDFTAAMGGLDIQAFEDIGAVYQKAEDQLQSLIHKHRSLTVVSNALEQVNGEASKLPENYKTLAKEVGMTDAELKDLSSTISDTEGSIRVLRDRMINVFGKTPEEADALIRSFTQMSAAEREAFLSTEQLTAKMNALGVAIKNGKFQITDWSKALVGVGKAATSVSVAFSAIQNLGRIFSDEDMTDGERLIAILTSVATLAPSLGEAVSGAKDIFKALEQAGNEKLNKTKDIASEVVETVAESAGTVVANSADDVAGAVAKSAGTMTAAGAGASGALGSVAAGLGSVVAAAAPYVLAIGAVVGVIWLAVKAWNADADAAKKAKEEEEALIKLHNEEKSQYEDLKSAVEDFGEAWNKVYDNEGKILKDLKKDTLEYKEAIDQANDSALELLKTNSNLEVSRRTTEGVIVLRDKTSGQELDSEEALNNYLASGKEALSLSESTTTLAQINTNNKSLKSQRTNLKRDENIGYWTTTADSAYFTHISDESLESLVDALTDPMVSIDEAIEAAGITNDQTISSIKEAEDALRGLADETKHLSEVNEQLLIQSVGDSLYQFEEYANASEAEQQALAHLYGSRETLPEEEEQLRKEAEAKYNQDFIFGWGNEDEVHEEFAKLKGWTKTADHWGDTATYLDEEGNEQTIEDDTARAYLINHYVAQRLGASVDEEGNIVGMDDQAKQMLDNLESLTDYASESLGEEYKDIFSEMAMANGQAIDLTGLTPEQIQELEDNYNKIANELGADLGTEFSLSLAASINEYDAIGHYLQASEKHSQQAQNIGNLLATYQSGEDLTEEQAAYLDELKNKYAELGYLQEKNQHEYLRRLRAIQEEEEANALKNLENARNKIKSEIDEIELKNKAGNASLEELKELDEKLKQLADTEYKIKVAIETDLASDVDQAFGLAEEIEQLRSYIADGLEISFDRAQELIAAGYGEMLTNAKETADATIMLNEDVVNRFIDGKQSEFEADRQSKIDQLELEKAALEAKRDYLQQSLDAIEEGLEAEGQAAKAEALIKSASLKAQADATEVLVNDEADTRDEGNKEISEDAADLVTSLGLLHEQDAENMQQAYSDGSTAANQSGADQVNAAKQVQAAWAEVAKTIQAASQGEVYENTIPDFSTSNTVNVGATGSQAGSSTYQTDIAEVESLLKDEQLYNEEVLNEALELAKESLQTELDSINSQIGSIDAGIAALKSAGSSLDKTQGGLGDSSGGSDNEGTKYDQEEAKDLKDIEERYHEINRAIERQADLLEDLETQADRTFGTGRLDLYDKSLEELEEQADNQLKKLAEAQHYLEVDKATINDLFDGAAIYNANGEIANYSALLRKTVDDYNNGFLADYNAFLMEYSALTKAEQEARKAEYESWQAAKEAAEAQYQARQDALAQYESTLDTIQDTKDAYEDLMRSIEDQKLTKVTYKMELVLQVKDVQDAADEFSKAIVESFGDALTHTLGVSKIGAEMAQREAALLPDYINQYNELKELMENANQFTDTTAIVDAMEELQSNIISSGEALLEWIETVETMLPDAIDAARDRFSLFTDQLEHNSSVLSTIKELLALQGVTYKTMQGFSALQKVTEERMDAAVADAELNRKWYEEARQSLLKAEEALVGVSEDDVAYDTLKNNRDALLAEFNEAQEAMFSSAQEAMEAAQEMYLEAVEKAAYDFGQAISGGLGLDNLQTQYDHYIEESERYLDTVNEAYQISAWYNKLQKDIDNTSNAMYRDRLLALQEEIDIRRENNTLSEYDLEILNAKYAVLQAQMALEDAQNAKNELRLVRDSQGNWNYQYTADQDAVSAATDDLLAADSEWYNIAKQQVSSVTGEIIATWTECQEAIKEIYSDMTLTDEERAIKAEEIYNYYTEKIRYLEEEKQNAILDMNEAGNKSLLDNAIITGDEIVDLTGVTGDNLQALVEQYGMSIIDLLYADNETIKEIIGSNTELIDLFDNVFAKDLANMTVNTENFETFFNAAMASMQNAFINYGSTIQDVANKTGTDVLELAAQTEILSTSTDRCRDAGLEMTMVMWETINAVQNASMSYIDMASSIMQAVYALEALAYAQGAAIAGYADSDAMNGDWDDYDYGADSGSGIGSSGSGSGGKVNPNTGGYGISSSDMADLVYKMGRGDYDNQPVRQGLVDSEYGEGTWATAQGLLNQALAADWENYTTNGTEWKKTVDQIVRNAGFATGGYTGDFQGSKLAFLHQKELVLNENDTSNMLAAVQLIRAIDFSSIERMLDGGARAGSVLMAEKLGSGYTAGVSSSGELEQKITIEHVEFPNVTSATEINEAFASLVNDAAQWAKRRKS